MHLTQYRTPSSAGKEISFPKLECWHPVAQVASVAANVNKKRVLCRISLKTLVDKYGASIEAPMQSVAQHRTAIQNAARKLIERDIFEEDGSVLIRALDLEQDIEN